MLKSASIILLLAATVSGPVLAQTAPVAVAPLSPASQEIATDPIPEPPLLGVPAPAWTMEAPEGLAVDASTTESVPQPLTALEEEACRRLFAEAQQAQDAALAPPAPPPAPEKKPMTRVEGAGAVTGSVVGQVAGAAVAGPVGAAVGALVVGKVGQKVANTAEKVLGGDKDKEAEQQAAVAPVALTVPGPPPELLSECQTRALTASR